MGIPRTRFHAPSLKLVPDKLVPEGYERLILARASSKSDKSAADRSHLTRALVSFSCLRCCGVNADAPVLTRVVVRKIVANILLDTLLITSGPIIRRCLCLCGGNCGYALFCTSGPGNRSRVSGRLETTFILCMMFPALGTALSIELSVAVSRAHFGALFRVLPEALIGF